jgi:hypothetical protein
VQSPLDEKRALTREELPPPAPHRCTLIECTPGGTVTSVLVHGCRNTIDALRRDAIAVVMGVRVAVAELEGVTLDESDGDMVIVRRSVCVELEDDVTDDEAVTLAVGVRVGVKQSA